MCVCVHLLVSSWCAIHAYDYKAMTKHYCTFRDFFQWEFPLYIINPVMTPIHSECIMVFFSPLCWSLSEHALFEMIVSWEHFTNNSVTVTSCTF